MRRLAPIALVALLAACPEPRSRGGVEYPPRPEGCAIQVFPDVPPMPTDNIGPVTATCDLDVSDADCQRTLKDQACKLGGDVLWGMSDDPDKSGGKKRIFGRAAHTKAGK